MSKQKITVVEDDDAIRNMYVQKLIKHGYIVSSASNGLIALDVLEQTMPDLILLDIKMPGLPGNEVLRRVRKTEWGATVKVIVLTNISKSEAPQEFRFLNIDSYIVKVHYTPNQVLDIITNVLKNKKF